MRPLTALLIALGIAYGVSLTPPAYAEKADRDKPTVVDSDKLDHDDAKQITIFTGNVVLTKGTLVMRGDRLELWQDTNGNYFGIMTGRPAKFRQKRDGGNEYMDGEGQRADYDGKTEIVVLTNNAIMRRYDGDVLRDSVAGDRLTYNNVTDRYNVDSSTGQGRSRMLLMPKSEVVPGKSPQTKSTPR